MIYRLIVVLIMFGAFVGARAYYEETTVVRQTHESIHAQFDAGQQDKVAEQRLRRRLENSGWAVGGGLLTLVALAILIGGVDKQWFKKWTTGAALLLPLLSSGCWWKPFKPVKFETIGTNEEAFVIPYVGDNADQASTESEAFLKAKLVNTKQVEIPQQWVPKGYEYMGADGEWRDAAIVIKVDRSPVTREWTADENSGTSNKNEAIWVMTADQVEFSTGWTVTARIASRDDAVKFLHNYRNETLAEVLDREVRAYVQTAFGLEVTDQRMDKLRLEATPHIKKVIEATTAFFVERGITITNLGISGGFIYKDKSIQTKLVEVFNAEQEQTIATSKAAALQKEAQGKADAAKVAAQGEASATQLRAEAEAEATKARADASAYEIEKAREQLPIYLQLRQLEVQKTQIEKWKGSFPTIYVGPMSPSSLLNLPPKTTQAP
jgi:regulator of protease activity HflC (stomatin/prohibitin superfamily)